jgi:hypothetical protein
VSAAVSVPPGVADAVSVAVRVPAAVGANTMLTVHDDPAGIAAPQVEFASE